MATEDWRRLSVNDIKAKKDGAIAIGPFGSRMKSSLYVQTGVPVIRGTNLGNTKEFVGDFVFVSSRTADELRSSNVFPDDLVFPHRGSIGEVGVVPRDCEARYVLSTSLMKLSCNPDLVDPHFLFYFFRSPEGRHELLKHASTVGTPGIGQPLSSLRSITIPVPPLAEQRAIAHILGSLDDKIGLNTRMNATLEGIVQALYKAWFVDRTSMPAEYRPSPTDKGDSPGSWPKGSMLEIVDLVSGGTPKTTVDSYWNGPIPWASAKDVSQCRNPFLVSTERSITQEGMDNSSTKMIPKYATVVVARGATTGRLTMLGRNMAMNQTCYALRAKAGDPFFIYAWFRNEVEDLVHAAHGSVFDTITTSTLENSRALLPPESIRQTFNRTVSPLFERILCNVMESEILVSVRDTLLPKLMSGDLRIPPSRVSDPLGAIGSR